MIAWLIIYIIGVLLVGGVSVLYTKEADEDVSLLDLMKLIVMSFFSWLAVLIFVLLAVWLWIEEKSNKDDHQEKKKGLKECKED